MNTIACAEKILLARHRKPLSEANAAQLHGALSEAVMLEIAPTWLESERRRAGGRRAFYLSAEYLVGRLVFNNLLALGCLEDVRALLSDRGVDLNCLEDVEDAALGNGGLGRLAACFLDSAATMGVPLDGYGLRYRFGLFKQLIEGGRQVEIPDDWAKWGDPWSVRRDEFAVTVPMKTGDVRAVPYDMPVIGLGGRNIGTLRLWQAESERELDFSLFNQQQYARASAAKNRAEDITKVLYPNDTRAAGKRMRIRQQYVLVSASLQDMLRQFDALNLPISKFPEMVAAQLNDTHPAMAIPELIRLLGSRGLYYDTYGDRRLAAMYLHESARLAELCGGSDILIQALGNLTNVLNVDRPSEAIEPAERALAIAERVVVSENGTLEVDIPYVALEMLTSAAQDRVFYRVDAEAVLILTVRHASQLIREDEVAEGRT